MSRGPKPKTAQNSRKSRATQIIRRASTDAPSDLTEGAKREYDRLAEVLESMGTLDRVDLAVLAEAGRIKDLLDKAHGQIGKTLDSKSVNLVVNLTAQRRGLLRELGLTSMPSRSAVKVKPQGSERDDKSPWEGRLKVG